MRFVMALLVGLLLAPAAQASITTANVNCRASPASGARVFERVADGTSVSVLNRSGTWAKIDRPRDCWVAARYLAAEGAYTPTRSYRPSGYSARTRSADETRRANRRSYLASTRRSNRSTRSRRAAPSYSSGSSCPCSGSNICVGPRGGRYCFTSGGNKRYGM